MTVIALYLLIHTVAHIYTYSGSGSAPAHIHLPPTTLFHNNLFNNMSDFYIKNFSEWTLQHLNWRWVCPLLAAIVCKAGINETVLVCFMKGLNLFISSGAYPTKVTLLSPGLYLVQCQGKQSNFECVLLNATWQLFQIYTFWNCWKSYWTIIYVLSAFQ